ncbi:Proteasome subunit alpha type-3, partial [Spiromyces aspiralis]
MSRRFDSKTNIFDPSGRIRQVENALEAVNHGSLVIGIKCSDGVLLCAERGDQSKLLESQQEKIYKID